MQGRAKAPAGGTVLMAFPTEIGAAFAIDEYVHATVELTDSGSIRGDISDVDDGDSSLIERCVEIVVDEFGNGQGGFVKTESDVNLASGLKSSSAAANATVLATLDALDTSDIGRKEAAKLGVRAARETGVTVTGAFDDASASMLGGLTMTDNRVDEVLLRDEVDWDVLVWSPPEQAFSSDIDVNRCRRVSPMANLSESLIWDGQYELAMTLNGFFSCAALGYPTDTIVDALPSVQGVSLSGSGPSFIAVGAKSALDEVQSEWEKYSGETWLTTSQHEGAQVLE